MSSVLFLLTTNHIAVIIGDEASRLITTALEKFVQTVSLNPALEHQIEENN